MCYVIELRKSSSITPDQLKPKKSLSAPALVHSLMCTRLSAPAQVHPLKGTRSWAHA